MSEFFIRSLDASTIFTIAALGELIGQRSGVLNVGIEGVMLFGATLGFIAAQSTGSYLLGFIVGIAIGGLLGLLNYTWRRPGCERDGYLDPRFRSHHLYRQPVYWAPRDGENFPDPGSFSIFLLRARVSDNCLVRALQNQLRAADQIRGRESSRCRGLGYKRGQDALFMCH